ncbi:glycosyl transferase family 2 [Stutzerimonas stutzeri]|uniref:Glycosyl transferase family 2 n=1 Tax=Stutzerimonas stutzeri TaxID=316 RepID=W8RVH8_STUST|nr:glycosyltransferase [Stutzerimonas stutzeri]AHL76061.1 glycosyl transferase family 2 [Stutzerimonas stutzeri]MCQ4330587.1 glycosyltransferase [Stutzerimonas stutzeri]
MTPKTSLVTVTYGDRLAYLQQLIERALTFVEIDEVIVVSNAALAPLEQLSERWPGKVRLIQLQHNTGSANGYAVALEAALAGGADYIWMMDDDNAPTAAAVSILHREIARLGGLIGPDRVAVLGYRATQQADIAQGIPPRYIVQQRSSYFGFHIAQLPFKIWRRLPWAKRPGKRPASISLPFAPYGGMLAHRSLYQRIGVPLKELVLYVDDTEYTRRITAGGGQLLLFTDAVIDELEQSWNVKARTRNIYETFLLGDSDFRAYYAARNQAWFDKNVWADSPRLHRLNRAIFLTLLRLIARLRNTRQRLLLIEQAIHDGENGVLGMSKTFPLR